MTGIVVRRLLQALVVVFGATLVTFILARVLPGDPSYLVVGPTADPDTLAAARRNLGLDDSLLTQYVNYMGDLLHGDLGTSLSTGQSVTTDLADRLPATLELAIVSLVMALIIAFGIGIAAALKPRGAMAKVADVVSAAGVAMPQFWLGLMLIYVFFFRLGWFPGPLQRYPGDVPPQEYTGLLLVDTLIAGDPGAWFQTLWGIALPAITLAITTQPPLLRIVQGQMQRALTSDPIRTARAVGLPHRRLVFQDALRLTVGPTLNMIGLIFGALLSSSVLVEAVFSWPGIGQYATLAINGSDYAAIQGVVLVSAVVYVAVFLLVDLIQLAIDPRLRTAR